MTLRNRFKLSSEWLGVFAVLLLIFINLYSLSRTGFLGDDIYNSCIRGNVRESGQSIWSFVIQSIKGWMNTGRFFPVTIILQYPLFYYMRSLFAYKIYLIIFTLLDIFLVGKVVKLITKSIFAELLVMLILGLSMPLHASGAANPLYMFNGLMQSVLFFGFLAIYFYISYSEKNKVSYLILSTVCSLLAMMTYEVGYAFPVIIFFISFFYQKNIWGFIKSQLWNGFSTVGIFGFTYLLRFTSSSISYDGIAVGFDIEKLIQTFKYQFLAAIPGFTYNVSKTNYNGNENTIYYYQTVSWKVIIIIVFLVCLLLFVYFNYNSIKEVVELKKSLLLIMIGGFVWIIPTTLISISSKYQNEISNSKIPYMPFFMEIFGMAIVLTGIICLINYYLKSKISYAIQILLLTACCIVVLPIYHGASQKEISDNQFLKGIREDFVSSIHSGILDQVEDGAMIVLDNRMFEPVSANIFTAYSERNIKTTYWIYQKDVWNEKYKSGDFTTSDGISYYDASNDNVWLAKPMALEGCGQVMLGKVKTVYFDMQTGQLLDVFLDQVSIYTDVKTNSSNNYFNTLGLFSDGALAYTEYPIFTYSDYYNVEEVDETAFLVRFGDTTIKSIDTMLFENTTIHEE